jgi:hypothetical protein
VLEFSESLTAATIPTRPPFRVVCRPVAGTRAKDRWIDLEGRFNMLPHLFERAIGGGFHADTDFPGGGCALLYGVGGPSSAVSPDNR